MIETELKFPVENPDRILQELENLGAEKVSEGLEHNEVFDNGELRKKGILLRLRKFGGRNILTLKKGISKDEFKEAEEIETEISSFEKAREILRKLGYEVSWVYEKKRKVYILGNAKISLDILPFASFIEIEGSREEIRKVAEKLNLDIKKGITRTYREIYEDFCKKEGRETENLVFWRKST